MANIKDYSKLTYTYEQKRKNANMEEADPLSKLAFQYESDRCPQIKHPFTPFYYQMLKDKRESILKVLEIGIGFREMDSWRSYRTGAGLLMWRDFFPNATIFGVDIDARAIIQDVRIKTFVGDQTKKEDLETLIDKIGSDIDLIIDDGSHKTQDQIFTCLTLMPLVKKEVIYIVEDVKEPDVVAASLIQYKTFIPQFRRKFRDDNVVVVTNT